MPLARQGFLACSQPGRAWPGPRGENEDYAGTSGSVTFTSGQTTKTVTVQVTNDDVSEDTEFFGFKISKPQGADLRGQRSEVVADVGLVDDDARGVTIDPTSISLHEPASGETAVAGSYTVNLNSKPTDTVTVTIGGSDPAVSLSGDTLTNNRLTFTTTNWNTAQTVTVTPVKDDNAVGETVTLTHTLSGGDYAGIAAVSVTINLTDSDTRNVVLSRQSLTVTEEDAAGSSYTVKLATQPSDTVTVTISRHDGDDLTLSGTTLANNQLIFTTTNWGTAQTVTVKAGDDDNAVDESETLAHTAFGGDHVNVTKDLPVAVTDDDTADVALSKTDLTVTEGDAAGSSYTVKLVTEPTGSVSVAITGHAGTDLTLSGTTLSSNMLTFTVDNWATAQTVMVKAGEDNDGANDTATLTHTASGGDYAGITADLPVTVTDDDTADIVFSETDLTVTEGYSAGSSYTVKLVTEPTGSVSVAITGHAGTDLTLDKTTLTFTVDNWATAQTVTVEAGEDDDGAADTATLTHTASGGDYASITADLPVTVTDDDAADVTIEPTALSVVAGRSNEYTVALATEPTGEVTVTVSGHASTDVTLDKTTLTFTVDNWDVAQTVTVTAAEDDDGVTDAVVRLTHTVSGGGYGSTTVPDVEVSITENDSAGVVISKDSLTVGEGDAAGSSYTVRLATRPSASVSVSITGHAGTDLTLDKTTLTFTVGNWDTAQTVTVKAGEDDDASNETATLTHTASGGDYALVSNTLPVTLTDDDTATIVLSETDLTVTEGYSAGSSYTVKLATQPSGSVSVAITGHAGTDLTLDKTTLTFTTDNWATVQTVTVSATQNAATAKVTLAHAVAGSDYGSVTAEPVVVSVVGVAGQQPTLQVGVSSSTQTLTISEGRANSYTLVLGSRPTGDVTVGVTLPTGTDLTLDKTSLTFTMDNWGDAQTVAVTAAEDDDAVTDAGVRLTHTVSGGGYGSTTVPDVEVSITENDSAGIVISKDSLTVGEGDAAGSSYTVRLATEPTGEVTVTVSGHAGTDLTLDKTTLTFTVDNWDVAQTVTVEGGHDVDGSADTATLTHSASGGDYASITVDLPVTVTDDDTAGVTIELTTDETTVIITDDEGCQDGEIWCATATFDAEVQWEGRYDLHAGEVDRREFSYNGEDYRLWSIGMDQNGHNAGDDNNIVLPFGIPERTEFLIDFFNLNGTGHDFFEPPNDDWMDWTLHVSTVSDGNTLTATLRFNEARKLGGAWWRWSGGDIDDLRRAWKTGQVYKLRLVEDPRSQRTPQPLNPPLYLRVQGEVKTTQTWLRWLTPQTSDDRVPPVDSYKIQWKQSSGSWGTAADVSETTRGPSRQRPVSHFLDGLTPGVEYNIRVIATDSVGDSEPSNEITYMKPASAQQSLSNTPAEGEPRIDGIPELGQTLSADPTGIEDVDGLENVVFQYQWQADDADIPGATGSTYTIVSGDLGKAITVRVNFTDDAGQEETLTSAPTAVVTVAGLQLQSATVDGAILTLTYNEVLDNLVSLPPTAFAVNVNGVPRSVVGVGFGESNVLLFLSSAVEAGDTVTVDYTAPDGTDSIRDTRGRKADSFSGQAVTNDTASPPLPASAHDGPSSHNGQDAFTFELRFSEDPKPDFSYRTVRDHAFTVTGGSVTYVRRPEPGKNVRWEITVAPGSSAAVTIALNATTDCSAQGAICTEDGGKLSSGLLLAVPGPNSPATGLPTITGTAQVGETLTADTTGISDGDGLGNATFAYQWFAADAEINGATASTYTLVAADAGKAIKVRVSFTDDAGNDEELTSAAMGAVATAPPPSNNPATGAPTITGAAQVGETLTAVTTGISDDDGLGNATFAYQWLADNAEINGATASTYTLVAADAGKAIRVRVSFTDDAGNDEELASAVTGAVAAAPPPNTPSTGVPTISGAAQVGETLTADATGISDDDGLDNATFAYQWLAADAEINGATASSYTLIVADAGKAIKVRVSFTDDAGNDEQLTSAATGAVAAAVLNPPLTATVHDVPSSHNGQDAFIFELRFSEAPKSDFSYTTVRDHAFTVTGGSVTYVRRLEPGKNVRWEITVTPGSSADVVIVLNATTDCEADSAICTADDRKLSGGLELTVNGPE